MHNYVLFPLTSFHDSIHPPLVYGQPSPIIIYLPTGPVATHSSLVRADDGEIVTALSAATNAHIVRLNYRLGPGVQYPTPIHDVLTGYDWVKNNLSHSNTSNGSSRLRIGVCGQLIGGSLAAMLALTESRMGESCIAAAALNAPIVDWIFPEPEFIESEDESEAESGDFIEHSHPMNLKNSLKQKPKPKPKPKRPTSWDLHGINATLPTTSLLDARSELFRSPANYFDSFASPILFFRSPGADVPLPVSDHPSGEGALEEALEEMIEQTTTTRRKVHRTFPPTGSSLRLPNMRISIGDESPLYDQSEELVLLLRRSIMRSYQRRSSRQPYDRFDEVSHDENETTNRALADAERRVEFHVQSQTGLWGIDSNPTWRADVMEAGAWFRKVLS
jgi:acetyl esterase/lipase